MQARTRVGCSLALLAVAVRGGDASAADPAGDSSWQQRRQSYEARGLGQDRGTPRAAPVVVDGGVPTVASSVDRGVVFVNFDGATLNYQSNKDDARTNTTFMSEFTGEHAQFDAYGDGAKRDAVLQAVRADWSAYDVEVTDTRPAAGEYVMNMTGPTNPFGGSTLGIAPLDCKDAWTHNNITFAFHAIGDGFSASETATTVSQEVAHSFGLEHVDEPGDIMNPFNAGGDAAFLDACLSIVPAPQIGILCGSQHEAECGTTDEQNAHAELLTLFGEPGPDESSPEVAIVEPNDGARFGEGADFTVSAHADDDRSIAIVRLRVGEQVLASRASPPFEWVVQDPPNGTYVFTVEAEDAAGNVSTSDPVSVTVGDQGPGGSNGGDEGPVDPSDDEGDEGPQSPENGSDGPEDDDDSAPLDPDDADESGDGSDEAATSGGSQNSALIGRGCAIASPRSFVGAAWLALLVLPIVRRRSRRGA